MPINAIQQKAREIKRRVDSEITEKFLEVVAVPTEAAALRADAALRTKAGLNTNNIYYHYLKGGAALTKLNTGGHPTSDWDFQVMPDLATYTKWATGANPNAELDTVHDAMIEVLEDAAQALRAGVGPNDVTVGMNTTMNNWLTGELLGIIEKVVREETGLVGPITVAYQNNQSRCYQVGRDMRYLPEWEMRNHRLFNNNSQRIEFGPLDTVSHTMTDNISGLGYQAQCTPTIYVNHTIPGFLLYRLAIVYDFRITHGGNTEDIRFKSEVVDLSTPRMGNPESYISVKDEVTVLSDDQNNEFKIPGWRYMLFENLLLIGEIELGVSGSPHKEAKRKERAAAAFYAIAGLNNNRANLKALGNAATIQEIPNQQNGTHRRGIIPQVKYDLLGKVNHFAASVNEQGPTGDVIDYINKAVEGNYDLAITGSGLLLTSACDQSNVNKLMKNLSNLKACILNPLTFSQVNTALSILLKPNSTKVNPNDKFKVVNDALLSTWLQLDSKDCFKNMDFPLGLVKLTVNTNAYNDIKGRAVYLKSKKFGTTNIHNVRVIETVNSKEILVSFNSQIQQGMNQRVLNQNNRAHTTYICFTLDANLDGNNPSNVYYEAVGDQNNGPWAALDSCVPYKLKSSNCEDLLGIYLQTIMLVQVRYPLMELYRQLKART
ncbi:hypothetical protein L1D15_00435 [Vibrio sp. Isolate25]|uniref:hypothetical protein n=1 Tax=Vibrio sp. Isolate25 TaxID=2908535 RepID=UPI001EFE45FF|nr:hypothetical protein [Vibrio sp. Isolate25]MCG9595178.1 hypothetical protein [Vibrio sp. Isolate25]